MPYHQPWHSLTRHQWKFPLGRVFSTQKYHNGCCPHLPYQTRTLCSRTLKEEPGRAGQIEKDEQYLNSDTVDVTERAKAMLGPKDECLSIEKWREIKTDFLNTQSNPRFEHFAMHYIARLEYYNMGMSLFDFMLAEKILITENIIGHYLWMCVNNGKGEFVLQWYDMWCKRNLELKPNLRSIVARGICATPHWRRSLEVLDEHQPHSKVYQVIIATACHHGDTELVAKLLREMHDKDLDIFDATVVDLLKMVQIDTACYIPDRLKEDIHRAVVKMLSRHREQRTFPTTDVIEVLQQYFKRQVLICINAYLISKHAL